MKYKVKFNLYEYNEYHYPYSETIKTIFIDAATYDQCRDIVQFRYPRSENIIIDAHEEIIPYTTHNDKYK